MLVGFTGRKRHGKDTAAEVFEGFEHLQMAGGLKAMLRAFLAYQEVSPDVIEQMVEGALKEVPSELLGGKTPRFFMQTLGTEFGRNIINEDLWVNASMKRASYYIDVKFTDIRFPNEFAAIREAGGYLVRINRPNLEGGNDEHSSETSMQDEKVDFTIFNDFTVECLKKCTLGAKQIFEDLERQ